VSSRNVFNAAVMAGRMPEGAHCILRSIARIGRKIMLLSFDAELVFILQSGVMGRLTVGRIERGEHSVLLVYDEYGQFQPYFSGTRLRSWCVVDPTGRPIPSWCAILPEDRARMLPSS
jgi:hypothetical protein